MNLKITFGFMQEYNNFIVFAFMHRFSYFLSWMHRKTHFFLLLHLLVNLFIIMSFLPHKRAWRTSLKLRAELKMRKQNIRTSWKLSLHAQCSQKTSQLIRHTSKTLIFRNDLNYKQEQVNFVCFFCNFTASIHPFSEKTIQKNVFFKMNWKK